MTELVASAIALMDVAYMRGGLVCGSSERSLRGRSC
jgi:hypothetical protein